ncbi:ADP-ribosylation factor family-domain-containing protein [Crucibulum laeve]|uniref:ADP-ribosylation factor family-domain-containing protein n=1 Tax=Crucibulum laeve TaxID=68775 RepID=A0A5C3MHF4_9AGAR|nr:ADP-ribosylation factor family-domain-containing protein [Crucibulum laeve]
MRIVAPSCVVEMASVIRQLIDRLYPKGNGYTVTIGGLDHCGKTTLLYLLKLGEIVPTISTIGFNIETVDVRTVSGRNLRMTGWDMGTGCGIQFLYGLLGLYTARADAIVWMVNLCDHDRLTESVDALKEILRRAEQERASNGEGPKHTPILILANKADGAEAMSVDVVRIKFAASFPGRMMSVFKTSLTSSLSESTLPEAFEWLRLTLDISKSTNPTLQGAQTSLPALDPRSSDTLAHKLDSWLTRAETDSPPEEFISQFHSIALPSWDHYTHIRIAYLILTTHGRQKGKDMIFKGIEKYILQSPLTRGRTFHVTMTYFWIQLVHFGIRNMPTAPNAVGSAADPGLPSPNDFAHFLLVNPYVADGNIWADYYSKSLMMSPKAKAEMVLPDKKPLPNLIVRDAVKIN